MAQTELIQKDLQTINRFAKLLQTYHDKEYLDYVEKQLLLLYGSRLDLNLLNGIKKIEDQLDRVLELLNQVRVAVSNLEGASSLGNLAENVQSFQKHQEKQLQEEAAANPDPSLSESRIELIRRLSVSSPNVNPATVEYVVSEIINDIVSEDPETTLQLAKQAIELLFSDGKPVPPEETVVILESLSEILQKTSGSFASDVSIAADISPEVATYAVTAAYTGSTLTPTPQFESALATAEQSPTKAAKVSTELTEKTVQVQSFLTQLQSSLKYAQDIDRQIHKQLSLDPNIADSQIHQTIGFIKASLPLLVTAHEIVTSKTNDIEKIRKIDALLAKIGGIAGYNVRASAVAAAQKNAAQNTTVDYAQLASQAPANTQIYYSKKSTKSKQLYVFLQDLTALETIDFVSVATVANKHFDLSGIDASLDKYFSKGGTAHTMARSQNFAGDMVARFVPGAKPIVELIKPLNKAFWLVVNKTVEPVLLWVGTKLREGLWKNFLVGFGLGGAIALTIGIPAGIAVGIGSLFVSSKSLVGGAAKVNAALTSAGAAAMAAFTSFMTVSFIVLLSIPVAVALILFIINNSAYIVPQAVGTIGSGGGPTTQINCFIIDGFSEPAATYVTSAINTIVATNYGQKLCSNSNQVFVHAAAQQYLTDVDGNFVLDANGNKIPFGGRAPVAERNQIYLFPYGTSSQNSATFTLAHESGHVFSQFFGAIYDQFDLSNISQPGVEGYLPSYKFGFSVYEDFAETVGIGIRFGSDYFLTGFNKHYSLHKQFFDNILNAS